MYPLHLDYRFGSDHVKGPGQSERIDQAVGDAYQMCAIGTHETRLRIPLNSLSPEHRWQYA